MIYTTHIVSNLQSIVELRRKTTEECVHFDGEFFLHQALKSEEL